MDLRTDWQQRAIALAPAAPDPFDPGGIGSALGSVPGAPAQAVKREDERNGFQGMRLWKRHLGRERAARHQAALVRQGLSPSELPRAMWIQQHLANYSHRREREGNNFLVDVPMFDCQGDVPPDRRRHRTVSTVRHPSYDSIAIIINYR